MDSTFPALRLHPDQQELTPTQEAEARRFAAERIQAQLSTRPADEQQAEVWLRQAYTVAGLAPPQRIHWLDGPYRLNDVLGAHGYGSNVEDKGSSASIWASVKDSSRVSVWDRLKVSFRAGIRDRFKDSIRDRVWASLRTNIRDPIRASAIAHVGARIWSSFDYRVGFYGPWDIVSAYEQASWLAFPHFFAVYLTSNEFQALARFNELVSGYWLGREVALVVRRPKVLSLDEAGRLHSATGTCIAFLPDGWSRYAWHGVSVPEKVILAPETLTREDFMREWNIEVRRVIQERMGTEQFIAKMGGGIIDSGPRGALYEVVMPPPPESWMPWDRVARYVQLQDASTERLYFLRVPPTIQTAAEAVAWSFQIAVEDYGPAQET
jgi:hypothetical protein